MWKSCGAGCSTAEGRRQEERKKAVAAVEAKRDGWNGWMEDMM